MSLKAFHIFFITIAALSSLVTGVWSVGEWRASGDGTILMLGVVSLVVLAGLVPYGLWFMKKFRNVSNL